jgi:hypothetical protein
MMGGETKRAESAADSGEGDGLFADAAGAHGATGGAEGAIGELGADLTACRPRNAGPAFAPQCGIREQTPRGRREEGACHGAAGEFKNISTGIFHLWQAHL